MIRNCIATVAAALALSLASGALAADTYKLDPVHSMVIFKINHLGVSNTYGRFDAPEGSFVMDDDAEKMTFEASISVSKIDTANSKRDEHLKSADFFNAKQFPDITFRSTAVKKTGDSTFDVTGDLSLHGVTKSITIPMTKVGAAKTQMGERAGFDATFTIKRSDFGMNFMEGAVGDEVTLMINLEGVKS